MKRFFCFDAGVKSLVNFFNVLVDTDTADERTLGGFEQRRDTGSDQGSEDVRDNPVVRVGHRDGSQPVDPGGVQGVKV